MTAHDPKLHDIRMAALLAGVSPDYRQATPGLARLLSSLLPAAAARAEPQLDMGTMIEAARRQSWGEGFAAGDAAGREATEAALAPLRAALEHAVAAAVAAVAIDDAALRPALLQVIETVSKTVLMAQLNGGRRVLMPLVEAALAELAEGALPILIAHPQTLALLGPELPPGLATAPDPALPLAHVVLSGPDYRIEAGLEDRLSRILKALA